jgi:hypothetical protein
VAGASTASRGVPGSVTDLMLEIDVRALSGATRSMKSVRAPNR